MDKLPILLDGTAVGELTVWDEGLYRVFQANCRCRGVFRLCAIGENGSLRLGVPQPQGEALTLCRRCSVREAEGTGRLLRGELQSCEEGEHSPWQPAAHPEQLVRSPFLQERLRGLTGAMALREGDVLRLALPYSPRQPFWLSALFCFARICRIRGQTYAVFSFDKEEWPVF